MASPQDRTQERTAAGRVGRSIATGVPNLVRGARAGTLAGLLFVAFEVAFAYLLQEDALAPLEMIGAVALGPGALSGVYSPALVTVVALVVHLALSGAFGGIFGLMATGAESRFGVIVFATVYGFGLWIVNFYVIAPRLFPWFRQADPSVQFVAHTFLFGTVLGAILAARIRKP